MGNQRGDIHLDLEVGDPVAVDVTLDDAGRAAKLSVDAGEGAHADEREGLIAGGAVGIGVDSRKVDLIALRADEVERNITVGARHAFGDEIEVEPVGAGAAGHRVFAEAADENVVPDTADQLVVTSPAAKRIVAANAIEDIVASMAEHRVGECIAGQVDR